VDLDALATSITLCHIVPGNGVTPSDFRCRSADNGAGRLSATERRAAAAVADVGSEAGQEIRLRSQNIYISGGARLTQTLVAGDIDRATTGGAVINAVLSGAELVYIALIVPTYGFSVYARPDLKDISSLKGKVVGVMTKGASADHGMIAVLRHNHLTPGQDVKFLYLGGVREALAALERGIVSASVLSAPTTLLARRMGFKEVVNIAR